MNSGDVHALMMSKGFWSSSIDDLQAHTWRQLCHVADELYEVEQDVLGDKDPLEELADVCIVILDLLGAHGVPFDPQTLSPIKSYARIEQVMRAYRKTGKLDGALIRIMEGCACDAGGTETLCEAIDDKIEKNAQRPHLYGVAREK